MRNKYVVLMEKIIIHLWFFSGITLNVGVYIIYTLVIFRNLLPCTWRYKGSTSNDIKNVLSLLIEVYAILVLSE